MDPEAPEVGRMAGSVRGETDMRPVAVHQRGIDPPIRPENKTEPSGEGEGGGTEMFLLSAQKGNIKTFGTPLFSVLL